MADRARAAGLEFDAAYVAAFHPDACAAIHDVRGFPYLRRALRPIGLARRANETLHPTAPERRGKLPGYRPRNLEDYLARERMAVPGDLVAPTPDQ